MTLVRKAIGAGIAAVAILSVTACGDDPASTDSVVTRYVDENGNDIPAPSDIVETTTVTASPPTTRPTVASTPMRSFTTPDGQTSCSSVGAGNWGGIDQMPLMGCMSSPSSIPKPVYTRCGNGPTRFGAAASLGSSWVTTGLCTGGIPFNDYSSPYPRATVGQSISLAGATCTIPASDTVECSLNGNSFRLSSTSVTTTGDDLSDID